MRDEAEPYSTGTMAARLRGRAVRHGPGGQTRLDPAGRHHQDHPAAGRGGDRVNLRQLLTWSRETGDITDPLTLMEVGPVSFEEIDQVGTRQDDHRSSRPAAATTAPERHEPPRQGPFPVSGGGFRNLDRGSFVTTPKRRVWDLNPRTLCGVSGFQDRCTRPLCEPSSQPPSALDNNQTASSNR
jgi:hypothetical protein